jgi:hypothetical protein
MLELTSDTDTTLFVAARHIVSVGPTENNDPRFTRIAWVNAEAVTVKGNFRDVAQKVSESLGEPIIRGPH